MIKEKLMVDLSFPLATSQYEGGWGEGGTGGRGCNSDASNHDSAAVPAQRVLQLFQHHPRQQACAQDKQAFAPNNTINPKYNIINYNCQAPFSKA